jgi:hypothetical protein
VPSTECPAALGRALLYRAELGLDARAALNICERWEGHDGHLQPAHATHCKEGVLAQYTLQTLGEGLRGLSPAPAESESPLSSIPSLSSISSLSLVRLSLLPATRQRADSLCVGQCRRVFLLLHTGHVGGLYHYSHTHHARRERGSVETLSQK